MRVCFYDIACAASDACRTNIKNAALLGIYRGARQYNLAKTAFRKGATAALGGHFRMSV